MIKVILSMLMLGILMGAEEAPKLPASVTNILEKTEQEITRNRIAYDRANARVLQNTERALQGEMDKLTKAGKLEEALAVKKVLSTVRTDLVNKVDENAKLDVLGDTRNALASFLTGSKWTRITPHDVSDCEFKADGTGTVNVHPVRWVIEQDTVKVTFVVNPVWTMTLKKTDTGFAGTLDDGKTVVLNVRK